MIFSTRFIPLIFLILGHSSTDVMADIKIDIECHDNDIEGNCIAEGRVKSIYLFNKITLKDLERVAYVGGQLPINMPFPKVMIDSDGADLDAAIGIGRILRWRKASVETYDISHPYTVSKCYSGCVLIAAGAVNRKLSMIGLHSGFIKYPGDENDISLYQPISEVSEKRIADYYKEMGISDEVHEIEKRTPFWEMSYFYFNPEIEATQQKIVQWGFR